MQRDRIHVRQIVMICLGAALLSACQDKPAAPGSAAERSTSSVGSSVADHASKLDEIDDSMAELQRHHDEDPDKVNRLLAECQAETGAVMEGEGALQITKCINRKW